MPALEPGARVRDVEDVEGNRPGTLEGWTDNRPVPYAIVAWDDEPVPQYEYRHRVVPL